MSDEATRLFEKKMLIKWEVRINRIRINRAWPV